MIRCAVPVNSRISPLGPYSLFGFLHGGLFKGGSGWGGLLIQSIFLVVGHIPIEIFLLFNYFSTIQLFFYHSTIFLLFNYFSDAAHAIGCLYGASTLSFINGCFFLPSLKYYKVLTDSQIGTFTCLGWGLFDGRRIGGGGRLFECLW